MGAARRLDADGVATLLRLAIGEYPSGALVRAVCERTDGEVRPLLRLLWQACGAADEPARALATLTRVQAASDADTSRYVFRREGEYWTIVFEGAVSRLRDRMGLRHLAVLLGRPGVRMPARALVDDEFADPERARVRVTKSVRAAIGRIAAIDPALGAHLRAAIRLGTACGYVPTDLDARAWEIGK